MVKTCIFYETYIKILYLTSKGVTPKISICRSQYQIRITVVDCFCPKHLLIRYLNLRKLREIKG
ncbi:hypothetical protein Hdeb2414_s0021g00575671 [Helianthus debilis subsp. tardiflorus]